MSSMLTLWGKGKKFAVEIGTGKLCIYTVGENNIAAPKIENN